MISLPLEWLVFTCLLVFLIGIFFFWISYEVVRRVDASRSVRNRLRCPICCMEFEDRSPHPLAKCPRCGSLNERVKPVSF
ncbi:MAG: hypothetical protein WCS65_09360 [Verrucomicrobiae bacterium]